MNFKNFKKSLVLFLSLLLLFSAVSLNSSFGSMKVYAAGTTGQDIVNYAKQFIGHEYQWGAKGPTYFDCSGFTYFVYSQFGQSIGGDTFTQVTKGSYVSKDQLQPGDLVFFNTYTTNGHVAIYEGGGTCIGCNTSTGVTEFNLSSYWNDVYSTARRIINIRYIVISATYGTKADADIVKQKFFDNKDLYATTEPYKFQIVSGGFSESEAIAKANEMNAAGYYTYATKRSDGRFIVISSTYGTKADADIVKQRFFDNKNLYATTEPYKFQIVSGGFSESEANAKANEMNAAGYYAYVTQQ